MYGCILYIHIVVSFKHIIRLKLYNSFLFSANTKITITLALMKVCLYYLHLKDFYTHIRHCMSYPHSKYFRTFDKCMIQHNIKRYYEENVRRWRVRFESSQVRIINCTCIGSCYHGHVKLISSFPSHYDRYLWIYHIFFPIL